jgi:hypothetical protein
VNIKVYVTSFFLVLCEPLFLGSIHVYVTSSFVVLCEPLFLVSCGPLHTLVIPHSMLKCCSKDEEMDYVDEDYF